jgi:hypothetical protein
VTLSPIADASDDLVPRHQRQFGIRQFAVDDVEVGAADATRCDLHHDLAGGRRGRRPLAHDEWPAQLLEHHRAHDRFLQPSVERRGEIAAISSPHSLAV